MLRATLARPRAMRCPLNRKPRRPCVRSRGRIAARKKARAYLELGEALLLAGVRPRSFQNRLVDTPELTKIRGYYKNIATWLIPSSLRSWNELEEAVASAFTRKRD